MLWDVSARKNFKKLVCFANDHQFLLSINEFDPGTPIYVDSCLDGGIKGEDVAYKLSQIGFKNLYLATGYSSDHFAAMPWITDVVGKAPPWVEASIEI